MKHFAIFILCIVAASANISHENPEKIDAYVKECAAENGIDEDFIYQKNDVHIKATPNQVDCYFACVHEKLGFLKEDGTYNLELIVSRLTRDDEVLRRNQLRKFVKSCEREVGKYNACKNAGCVYRAAKDHHW